MLTKRYRHDAGNDVSKAADYRRNSVCRQIHCLSGDNSAVCTQRGCKNTHQDGCAHQSGAHHKSRACVEVDDLLVHLSSKAVVHEQCDRHTDHERIVAGEYVPDQHCDNAESQSNVEDEKSGALELVVLISDNRLGNLNFSL